MKRHLFKKLFLTKAIVGGLLIIATFASCEKNQSTKGEVTTGPTTRIAASTPDSSLVKFLSITLGVNKTEVKFEEETGNYVIRGNKFPKADIDSTYKKANVYQLKHGK
jgi:hypothetical protein